MGDAAISIVDLSDSDFDSIRDIIYKECGTSLTDGKKALVRARLLRRLRELRLPDYQCYYQFLRSNYTDEIVNLINCITTNKTEFFRENKHFEYLTDVVLPQFESSGRKSYRIWCAGCSTGEEPYTMAITLLEYFNKKPLPDIKILATDIDTRVLQTAKDAVYLDDVIDGMRSEILSKYFLRGKGTNSGLYRVKDRVRRLVHFGYLNLTDEKFPMKGKFDIIFCRNVIIYFNKETQMRLFKQFHRYLNDDAYLFVGHSESLMGINDLFRFRSNSVYGRVN